SFPAGASLGGGFLADYAASRNYLPFGCQDEAVHARPAIDRSQGRIAGGQGQTGGRHRGQEVVEISCLKSRMNTALPAIFPFLYLRGPRLWFTIPIGSQRPDTRKEQD